MIGKIGGAVLLALGVVLAVGLLGGVVSGLAGVAELTVKILIVSGLTYWGWRWLNNTSGLAKVAGAFILVAGSVLSFPLMGQVIAGAFGLAGTMLKVALAGTLIYFGWRWLRNADVNGALPRRW